MNDGDLTASWLAARQAGLCAVCHHHRDMRRLDGACGASIQSRREHCGCRCDDYREVWVVRERRGPYVQQVKPERWVMTSNEARAQRYTLREAVEVAEALPLAADVERGR